MFTTHKALCVPTYIHASHLHTERASYIMHHTCTQNMHHTCTQNVHHTCTHNMHHTCTQNVHHTCTQNVHHTCTQNVHHTCTQNVHHTCTQNVLEFISGNWACALPAAFLHSGLLPTVVRVRAIKGNKKQDKIEWYKDSANGTVIASFRQWCVSGQRKHFRTRIEQIIKGLRRWHSHYRPPSDSGVCQGNKRILQIGWNRIIQGLRRWHSHCLLPTVVCVRGTKGIIKLRNGAAITGLLLTGVCVRATEGFIVTQMAHHCRHA